MTTVRVEPQVFFPDASGEKSLEEIDETQTLAALLGIAEMVAQLTDTAELLDSVVRIAPSLVRVDRCAVFSYDAGSRELVLAQSDAPRE